MTDQVKEETASEKKLRLIIKDLGLECVDLSYDADEQIDMVTRLVEILGGTESARSAFKREGVTNMGEMMLEADLQTLRTFRRAMRSGEKEWKAFLNDNLDAFGRTCYRMERRKHNSRANSAWVLCKENMTTSGVNEYIESISLREASLLVDRLKHNGSVIDMVNGLLTGKDGIDLLNAGERKGHATVVRGLPGVVVGRDKNGVRKIEWDLEQACSMLESMAQVKEVKKKQQQQQQQQAKEEWTKEKEDRTCESLGVFDKLLQARNAIGEVYMSSTRSSEEWERAYSLSKEYVRSVLEVRKQSEWKARVNVEEDVTQFTQKYKARSVEPGPKPEPEPEPKEEEKKESSALMSPSPSDMLSKTRTRATKRNSGENDSIRYAQYHARQDTK